jgi:pilus assembly protein CpaF
MAGFELPVRAIREQMASALDVIVHLSRLRDGTRRVTHVTEVEGLDGDQLVTHDLFLFDYGMGLADDGRFRGHLKATGTRPVFAERLADVGVPLDDALFEPEEFVRR